MKHLLLTTIAAVVLVGCSKPSPPDISIHLAAGANNGKKANIEAIKQHLAAGTNVNAKDARDGGKTPLMHAVFWGHKEIAEVLVSNGGDSNITDDTVGATSLHYSVLGHDWEVSEDRYRIVEILIANGAKVNALANQGRITRRGGTALDMAITSKQVETADLLRKHGGKTREELKTEGATGKTDVQSTGKKQEAELATFLPGKRIYFRMPMPGDPEVPIEPAEPEPKLFLDEPEIEPGKKPTSPEIVWQFEKDGTITMGVFSDGGVDFFEGQKMSYKVNGLGVAGFEDGKEGGGMTFSSANPKKGDKVLMGEKGQEEIPVTITRIQDASSPPPVSKKPSQPPVSPAKTEPVAETSVQDIKPANPEADKALLNQYFLSDIDKVKQYLADGANVNAKDKRNKTPLHNAAYGGHREIAELLIDKGANVNAKDKSNKTPLHAAALYGRKEFAELLINKGADMSAKDKYEQTPLHVASNRKKTGVVKLLIDKGADVNAKSSTGTPLHKAVGKGLGVKPDLASSKEIAELLIKKGSDVNAKIVTGTPLHLAASLGHKGIIELLINEGADVNAKLKTLGDTPLHQSKTREVAELLITKGADVNAESMYRGTPLHAASKEGRTEVVELLIAEGVNVNAKDMRGETPLHTSETKKIAELLIEKGADVNAKGNRGDTPLHEASDHGKTEIIELLIAKGAEVNAIIVSGRNQGKTSLDLAIWRKKTATANLLRKHGGKTGEELKAEGK